MRKNYINRLNNYSEKVTALDLEAADLEYWAEFRQMRGQFGTATSLMAKAEKLRKRSRSWDDRAMALVEKMTEDEFYASNYPSEQCVGYDECTAHYD